MSTTPTAALEPAARDDAAGRGVARRRDASLVLMTASGFAGLGYQVVWTQQCASWLGHEAAAVLAVVAAFFGGLALGALATGGRIERSARPRAWYAACEATIAAWGVVLYFAMPAFGRWIPHLIGVQATPPWQWTVAFAATFVLLLPATAAMGATLPAIERVVADASRGGRSIAAHYASNTAGAVLGVLACTFWLVPAVGLARTALICSAVNLLCGIASLAVFPTRNEPAAPSPRDPSSGRYALFLLAMTGLFGIGYEVLVVRVLSQVAEDTVYTFALLLATYLAGSAAGAALLRRRRRPRLPDPDDGRALVDRLLCALAIACLIGTASLWGAEWFRAGWLSVFGDGLVAAVGVEAALAALAFGLPTLVMGALFSHLCATASDAGIGFGRSLGSNALAATAAPPLFGVLLTPLLGPKLVLLSIVAGYLALAAVGTSRVRVERAARGGTIPVVPVTIVAATVVIVMLAFAAPPLAFVTIPDGGRLVSYRDGVMAAVSVTEDADGVARLRIDNRQQEGTSATRFVDGRQALLPLLLHHAPRSALFLGLGTGTTAATAADDATLDVDAVELLPEVIDASRHFAVASHDRHPSRLHVTAADARRYVRATPKRYDVIVADNFHPARSGSGALYTVEHFAAIRDRLNETGLFCQWLPLHQLDLETLRHIVPSFVTVYPDGWALLANNSLGTPVIGLLARRDGRRFDAATVRERLVHNGFGEQPAAFGIDDAFALLGSFVAGPAALTRFAGDAAPNTDDDPVVTYLAPRITYAPTSAPADRLSVLLDDWSIAPDELVVPDDAAWSDRLAAYWTARDRFIAAGRGVRPTADVRAMLAQVERPLLAVLNTSPDFRPAYDPLLKMAMALAQHDVPAARTLLLELARTQPARPEAQQALAAIDRAESPLH